MEIAKLQRGYGRFSTFFGKLSDHYVKIYIM